MSKTVVIVGNGVSTAYNPALQSKAITKFVLDELARRQSDSARAAAVALKGRPIKSFEELLESFESLREATRILADGPFVDKRSPIHGALQQVSHFSNQVYRYGMAVTLQQIADSSHNVAGTQTGSSIGKLRNFGRHLASLGEPNELTFATLSFDGLLHAALIDQFPDSLFDQADGHYDEKRTIVKLHSRSQHPLLAQPLRDRFVGATNDGAQLLQLHGSLGWLRNTKTGFMANFAIDDLRASHYWQQYRRAQTEWEPVVLATNRKETAITQAPFALPHSQLREKLAGAERVLILGYGFGDEPVQRMLREEILSRKSDTAMKVLVSGMGQPPQGLQDLIDMDKNQQIFYTGGGIEKLFGTRQWSDFNNGAEPKPFPLRPLEHGPDFF